MARHIKSPEKRAPVAKRDTGPATTDVREPLSLDARARLAARTALAVALLALALWIAADFLAALIWAGIFAIATWPLYVRFASNFSQKTAYVPAALAFTLVIGFTIFLPLALATYQVAQQSELLLAWIAQSREHGIPVSGMGCPATGSCKCNHRVVEGESQRPEDGGAVVRNIQSRKFRRLDSVDRRPARASHVHVLRVTDRVVHPLEKRSVDCTAGARYR